MRLQISKPKGHTRDTNILDVKVHPKLRIRNKCGKDFVDESIGGGFVPSTVVMLNGDAGTGKTTLLLEVADGLTAAGHCVLFNTGEESLYQTRMVAERLNLQNGFYCDAHIYVDELIEHADYLAKKTKKQVFIIQDSLQTLNDGKYADGGVTSKTPQRCLEIMTDWAKKTFNNVIFIGQVTKGGEFAGKNTIKHTIDVRMNIFFDEDKRSETFGERIYEVTKNRFGGARNTTFIIGMIETGTFKKGSITYGDA